MQVWVDGRVLADPAAPALAADDHGLVVGDGVFEAVKVVRGQPFALSRHLRRLARSAAALALPEPDEDQLRTAVRTLLDLDPLPRARIRITVTAGRAPLGSARSGGTPTHVVAVAPLGPAASSARIATVPWPRNEYGALAGVKSTSYAENVLALARAGERGADEAIFANTRGALCEGTGSNVIVVSDGVARTPPLESGCLAGITRELLLEWADGLLVEDTVPMTALAHAQELALTSTTRDVQPVAACDGRELRAPGPVTRRLQEIWRAGEERGSDP